MLHIQVYDLKSGSKLSKKSTKWCTINDFYTGHRGEDYWVGEGGRDMGDTMEKQV